MSGGGPAKANFEELFKLKSSVIVQRIDEKSVCLSDSLPNKEIKSLYDVKSKLSRRNLFTLDRTLICSPDLSSLIVNSDLKSLTRWY